MTQTLRASRETRNGATPYRPHTATVHEHVAARLGPKCTGKGVEHKIARSVLLFELLIEEAYSRGLTEQVEKIFARLNAHRHAHVIDAANALRRHVVANSTELVERCAWLEARDSAERRREIEALAEEISAAEVYMVQLEGAPA